MSYNQLLLTEGNLFKNVAVESGPVLMQQINVLTRRLCPKSWHLEIEFCSLRRVHHSDHTHVPPRPNLSLYPIIKCQKCFCVDDIYSIAISKPLQEAKKSVKKFNKKYLHDILSFPPFCSDNQCNVMLKTLQFKEMLCHIKHIRTANQAVMHW